MTRIQASRSARGNVLGLQRKKKPESSAAFTTSGITSFPHWHRHRPPNATIKAISGHLSRKMLEHYSHVRLEAKHRAVEALDAVSRPSLQ